MGYPSDANSQADYQHLISFMDLEDESQGCTESFTLIALSLLLGYGSPFSSYHLGFINASLPLVTNVFLGRHFCCINYRKISLNSRMMGYSTKLEN